MTAFRTLDQADFEGKRVLVRVDLNVPMEDGRVTDRPASRASCRPSARSPRRAGRSILLAHFGRPEGPRPEGVA